MSIRPNRVDRRLDGRRDGRVVAHVGGERQALDAERRHASARQSRSAACPARSRDRRAAGPRRAPRCARPRGPAPGPWPAPGRGPRPVISATCPARSDGRSAMAHDRARSRRRSLAIGPEVLVEIDPQRVVEQVGRDHQPAEGRQGHDLLGSRTPRPAGRTARRRRRWGRGRAAGRSRRRAPSRSSSAESSGSSPASISSRRKKVEQIRQSVRAEIAWANSIVARSPRNGCDLVAQVVPGHAATAAPPASAPASASCWSRGHAPRRSDRGPPAGAVGRLVPDRFDSSHDM